MYNIVILLIPRHISWFFFLVLNCLRWKVVVCFVDIGGINDHHCLNFVFAIYLFSAQKWFFQNSKIDTCKCVLNETMKIVIAWRHIKAVLYIDAHVKSPLYFMIILLWKILPLFLGMLQINNVLLSMLLHAKIAFNSNNSIY